MKAAPQQLHVAYCTKCGEIIYAGRRPPAPWTSCTFCVGHTVVKALRYRRVTAVGAEARVQVRP